MSKHTKLPPMEFRDSEKIKILESDMKSLKALVNILLEKSENQK